MPSRAMASRRTSTRPSVRGTRSAIRPPSTACSPTTRGGRALATRRSCSGRTGPVGRTPRRFTVRSSAKALPERTRRTSRHRRPVVWFPGLRANARTPLGPDPGPGSPVLRPRPIAQRGPSERAFLAHGHCAAVRQESGETPSNSMEMTGARPEDPPLAHPPPAPGNRSRSERHRSAGWPERSPGPCLAELPYPQALFNMRSLRPLDPGRFPA